jgi:hypothetical protein
LRGRWRQRLRSVHSDLSGRRDLRERDGPHRESEEPKPMMHGHDKSDLVIVAMKPANKAKKAPCGGICAGGRSGVGGAKGGGQGECAPAKHALDPAPGSRVKSAGAYTATCAVTHPRREPIWAGACDETHRATPSLLFQHPPGHARSWCSPHAELFAQESQSMTDIPPPPLKASRLSWSIVNYYGGGSYSTSRVSENEVSFP